MDLRTFRRQRGLTQDHIGVLGGLDAATVGRIETGQVRARAATIVKLARALGVKATRMKAMCDEAWNAAHTAADPDEAVPIGSREVPAEYGNDAA